jgi:hypothetical protein
LPTTARAHRDLAQVGAWLACLARLDEPRTARGRLEEAEAALRAGGPVTELGVALCRRAEVEVALGDPRSASVVFDEAEALARRTGVGPRSPLGAEVARVRALVHRPELTLVVDADGARFRLGSTEGDLARRHAIRRVLVALAGARRERPGEALDVDALFAAGWPGEQAVHDAARERVYHAVGTLRRLGLGDVLQRVEGGWRLDPTVPLA